MSLPVDARLLDSILRGGWSTSQGRRIYLIVADEPEGAPLLAVFARSGNRGFQKSCSSVADTAGSAPLPSKKTGERPDSPRFLRRMAMEQLPVPFLGRSRGGTPRRDGPKRGPLINYLAIVCDE